MNNIDELDLTPSEIEELQAEGLLPEDYGSGLIEREFHPGPAEAGGALPPPALPERPSMADANTALHEGIDLLGKFQSPPGGMAKRFHDLAVSWMPTSDKDLSSARLKAQEAADQLSRVRMEAEARANRFQFGDFSAALLQGGWGNPVQRFGSAYQVAQKARQAARETAQKMNETEALAKERQATSQENSVYKRMEASAAMERSAALLQRAEHATTGANGAGTMSKLARDLGIDINTPEGQMAVRRMFVMKEAKSDPATLRALMENPNIDPFTPEFAELVAKQHLKQSEDKEAQEALKEKRAGAKEDRAENRDERQTKAFEIQSQEANLRIRAIQQKLDAALNGKPLPTTAVSKFTENQQNLRRAQRAAALLSGAEVGGEKGDQNATGWKGYIPDPILQRTDPSGTSTRAAIADLSSLIIHERSGAAVTASEYPRLAPFIPKASDDPKVARQKVQKFLQEYQLIQAELAEFYSDLGYNVPTNALKGITDIPATGISPTAPPAAPKKSTTDGKWKVIR